MYSRGRWSERTRKIGGGKRKRWGLVYVCACTYVCHRVCVLLQTPWGADLVIEITTDCHAHSQKLENMLVRRTRDERRPLLLRGSHHLL